MKKRTNLAQRVEIGERSDQGETDRAIASAMHLSVSTVRKWRRQWQQAGRSGLHSPMGRPACGPLGQWSAALKQAIRQMRGANPGWGPETIRVELRRRAEFAQVPCRASIAKFLAQEGLTRKYARHSALPQPPVHRPSRPHEAWEMDAQGVRAVPPAGAVSLINICDVFTTLKIDSYPCMHTRKPSTLEYQCVLRRAFVHFGLPERLALDHDSVFYDNTSASPYPTPFHLWALALGIEVTFGRPGRPTDQATVERAHQTLTQQALRSQGLDDQPAIQAKLNHRLDFLAHHYPSRSLAGRAPLVAFPEAVHSGRPYRPEWETQLLDLHRVYRYLAQGRWFRQVTQQGQFSLGGFRYGSGVAFAQQTLEITFDAQALEFVCLAADASTCLRLPVQGLSALDLMGELGPYMADFPYQLALPFSPEQWRQLDTVSLVDWRDLNRQWG